MTQFLQVADNSKTLAVANSLNNTTSPITLSGINTTLFPAYLTGYIVTVWDDVTYPDPGDDPNTEQALVTAATIGSSGSFTLTRADAKAHVGTPRIALLGIAQHISDLNTAVNALETGKLNASAFIWGGLTGDINNQTDLIAAFNDKADVSDLNLKAPLISPALTGNPTVPTQINDNNSTRIANTEFVQTAVAGLVNSSPAALDTLKELADALGDDPNFATTVTNTLATKAPLAAPAFTGNATFDTSTLYIDATNHRVGLGTSAPGSLLHLKSTASGLTIENTSTTSKAFVYLTDNTAGNNFFEFDVNSSGTGNTNLLSIPNSGLLRSGAGSTGGMLFVSQATGAPIIFATGGFGNANERMRIDGNGAITISSTINGRTLATDGTKLDSIATGATANSPDATLLNRSNHTGTQPESTITNLVSDLAAKAATTYVDTQDALKVSKSGDTMTGNLTIQAATGGLAFSLYGGATGDAEEINLGYAGTRYWHFGRQSDGSFAFVQSGVAVRMAIDTSGNFKFTGNNSPSVNNTYTLGTSALYWSNLYATTLNLNATASLSGSTAGQVLLSGSGTSTTLDISTTTTASTFRARNTVNDAVFVIETAGTSKGAFGRMYATTNFLGLSGYINGTQEWLVGNNGANGLNFHTNSAGVLTFAATFDSSQRFGLGTTAPTHTLTLPSTATGIALYVTASQTTNYERILQYSASSVHNIETQAAGTGVARPIKIGGATSKITVQPDGVVLPVQAITASAPTYVKGGIYFDTTLNKLRVGGATAWETVTSS